MGSGGNALDLNQRCAWDLLLFMVLRIAVVVMQASLISHGLVVLRQATKVDFDS